MRTLMRERKNAVATAVLSVALLATLTQAIVRSDGYEESRVSLDNGSVWVTWNQHAGRLNLESRKIEIRMRDRRVKAGQPTDLAQTGSGISFTSSGGITPITDATGMVADTIDAPESALFGIGGLVDDPTAVATAVLADSRSGRVWTADTDSWMMLDRSQRAKATIPGGQDPDDEEDGDATGDGAGADDGSEDDADQRLAPLVMAVGRDGSAHLHRGGTDQLHVVTAVGSTSDQKIDRAVDDARITAVGGTGVLLDTESRELFVGGGSPIDLTELGEEVVLQQPGPEADRVLIATESGLWAVPFDGGSARRLVADGGGRPVEPVWVTNPKGSCAYGAWEQRATWGRWCEGDDDSKPAEPLSKASEKFAGGNKLMFRVNHDRAVLNDLQSGANLLVDLPKPVVVDDWDRAEDRERSDDEEELERDEETTQTCSENPPAPETRPVTAGTRAGFPVVVWVLDEVRADPCDTLTIEPYDPGELDAIEGADVAVVEDGAALQITPHQDRTAEVVVPFTAVGAGGSSSNVLRVEIKPDGSNSAPVTVDEETIVTAGSIRGVTHNVLHRAIDPDGDALTLVSVSDETTNTAPRFEANGAITYVPPGNTVGPVKLAYTVTDGRQDGVTEGTLTVHVQPPGENRPPTPRPDRLTAFVGRASSVDVLLNDSDPDGDRLTLAALEGAPADLESLGASFERDGLVNLKAPQKAGRYVFETLVSDGQESTTTQLVVTVLDTNENLPPIAVRDDLVARPEVPALVDLLANDIDPEGDLLAVSGIEAPPESGVAVELLERRVARVTVPPSLTEPVSIPYHVSDGTDTSSGVLVVRPLFESAIDQSPIAKDDEASVKAGATAAVPVLRNDVDPEGEQLEIVDVQMVDETQGMAFVQRDQLRVRPNVETRGTMLVAYTIADPAGNQADAFVHVEVLDPETENRPPQPPEVEGRVTAGSTVAVKVPLLELDPDGDPVHLVGLDPTNLPRRGTVTFTAEGFEYQPHDGVTGSDEFQFLVSDGLAETAGTAEIVITPPAEDNRAPVAVPDRIRMAAGGERIIPVLANDSDPDDDPLRLVDDDVEGIVQPQEGLGTAELTEDGQAIRFYAPSDIGSEPISVSFSYGVTDGLDVSRGMVIVEVVPGKLDKRPPKAIDDAMTPQLAGSTVDIDVFENDSHPEGDKNDLSLEVLDDPDAVYVEGGVLRVTLGEESKQFAYEISDGDELRSRALVTIPVVDQLPLVLETAEIELDGGQEKALDLAEQAPVAIDVDLVYEDTVQGLEMKGIDGSTVTMRADPEWTRGAGFLYLATSKEGDQEAVGAVRARITGQKIEPTVRPPEVTLPEGASREVDLPRFVEDPDTAQHTFTGLTGAVTGRIDATLTGSTLRIEAGLEAKGTTTELRVMVSDGDFDAIPMVIPVTVEPNDRPPPQAVADSAETDEETPVDVPVLRNDSDPIGEGLDLVSAVVQPGEVGGSVTTGTDSLTFTPASGGFGVARIAYTIEDASKRQATGMVEVRVYGRPGKPATPSGTAENGLVRLQWQAPTRGGAPVTGYLVREVDSGRIHRSGSTSMVIDGLQNGTPHRFQVAALNRVVTDQGDVRSDEWSDPSPQLIPDAAPPQPAAPTVVFDKDRNNGGSGGILHANWQAPPPYAGSPVKEYVVNLDPPDQRGRSEFRFPASTQSAAFGDLQNGQRYSFTVKARNDAGTHTTTGGAGLSPASASASEIPAGVPSPPRGVSSRRSTDPAYVSSGGVAEVRWDAPASDGGDPPGIRYRVESAPAGQDRTGVATASQQVTGLNPNTTYRFRVQASNKAGDGAWSEYSAQTNVGGRPAVSAATMLPANSRIEIKSKNGDLKGAGSGQWQYSHDGGGFRALPSNNEIGANNGTRYNAVRLRLCNTELFGEGEGVACSEPVNATNSVTGATWVTPYGPPPGLSGTAGSGLDGGKITWTWRGQPDTETNPGGTSRLDDYGFGGPRTQSFNVSVKGQGGPTYTSSASASTNETRSVTVSKGRSVQGQPDCGTGPCRWVEAQLNGFPPGSHHAVCWGSYEGEGPFFNFDVTGNAVPSGRGCYFGYPGHRVWMVIDDIKSNEIVW